MLQPGRSGYAVTGGWAGSSTTSGSTASQLTLSSRRNNTPAEYTATESIEFTTGFESGTNDTFEAYTVDGSSGSGSSGSGNGYAGGGYRYGFNGKENDNEVKGEGDQQDYGMRIYDPRGGRFLSVDPMSKSYPYLTPYQFASNSPIAGIDLDGLEFFKKDNTQYTIDYKPVVNAPGVLAKADNAAHNAMSFVWNVTLGAALEGAKSVNNYFAGGYKEPSTDIVAGFNQFQTEAYKYHTTTPIKQQLKDFGNIATDLRNYELPAQLLIAHKLSAPATPIMSSGEIVGARYRVASSFYEKAGFAAEDAINHMGGINFEKPFYTTTLKKGTVIQQWVGKRGVGNYFTTLENGAARNLGIGDYDKRVLKQFTLTEDVKVLKSTAGDFQGNAGGGTQFFSTELKTKVVPQK